MLPWLLTGLALAIAAAAWMRAGRLSRKLRDLTQSYWDLKYELGQLRARIDRPDAGAARPPSEDTRPASFVPLSALARGGSPRSTSR